MGSYVGKEFLEVGENLKKKIDERGYFCLLGHFLFFGFMRVVGHPS